MPITQDAIINALRMVQDPELFKDIVTLNMVKKISVSESTVAVEIELTTPACPMKDKIKNDVTAAIVREVPGVTNVAVSFSANVRGAPGPAGGKEKKILAGVKNIVAVGAGKGGVGKSTVAVNLAVGLALQGAKVGLLDGDIYGPSVPTLVGLGQRPPAIKVDRIIPFEVGPPESPIRVMSIGFMVDKEKALIPRGPMAHGAIKQFLEQVEWGELDYLIVDLPPGTGDVSLTLAQTVGLAGGVIVATPQEVALMDARRAVRMFQQLGVEVLGVVENMSYFVCEHGTEYDIFGRGGAKKMAETMGIPFLGEVPIDMQLRVNSDEGNPYQNFAAAGKSRPYLQQLASTLAGQISVRNATRPVARTINLQIS